MTIYDVLQIAKDIQADVDDILQPTRTQQFSAKAFIDDKPVEAKVATYAEAKDLYWLYRATLGCDAAYIYEGDRILESWSQSYDVYLDSIEGVIDEDEDGEVQS